MANVGRHPSGSARSGSASPLTSTAAGMAACLMPKARPWRASGTWSAMNRLIAGCVTAFARPATARRASSTASDCASRPASRRQAALATTQARIERSAPSRSASRPPGPAPSGAGGEEHRDAGGHGGDAHVEVGADLERERPDEEAGQHGGRPGGDRQAAGAGEPYARPTTFAIVITPTTHRTAPMMSKTSPALSIRVIGSRPDE